MNKSNHGFYSCYLAFNCWWKHLKYGGYDTMLYYYLGCQRTMSPWNFEYYLEGETWEEIPF